MRLASKTDGNQRGIIDTFRRAGASVQVLSAVGHGCPDLAIGYKRKTFLIECKTKRGKFTSEQVEWWATWRGQAQVIRSCLEAIEFLNKVGVKSCS